MRPSRTIFPERLRLALSSHSFDRVVADLRPVFVQYRGLKEPLVTYRERETSRARQIELAMERLRWLPDYTGGRLVVVNIPMFYLWGWESERSDGIPGIDMAAITGRARSTRTPVFDSTITSVVFNPEWVVPDSIASNEILPAIAANPDYLAQHHMEMSADGRDAAHSPASRTVERAGPHQVRAAERARGVPARHAGDRIVQQRAPRFQSRLCTGRRSSGAGVVGAERGA